MPVTSFPLGSSGGISPAEIESAVLRASDYLSGVKMPLSTSRVTSRLVVGSIINEDIADGPFTIWCRFRVPSSLATNSGVCGLSPSETHLLGGSGSNSIAIAVFNGDVQFFMGNSSTYTRYPVGASSLTGQSINVVVTRSGSTLAIYLNGTPVTLAPVDQNGSVAINATISATWAHAASALSSTISASNNVIAGPVQRFTCFNRAITESEASDLIREGVDPTDQWGSKTAVIGTSTLNGGFETAGSGGADVFANWTESAGSGTFVRDTAIFDSGTASARFDVAADNGFMSLSQNVLIPGRRYRVSVAYRHARVSGSFSPQASVRSASNITWTSGAAVPPNTWGTFGAEVVCDTANFSVARNGSVGPSVSQWYDSVTVTRIGAFLDLDFASNSGSQVAERANQRDANSYNGAGFTLPQARQGFASWVAVTPGGERMGGSSGLVIPLDAAITRIVVENISIGSGQTVNIGATSGTITDIVNAAAIGGNGSITVIDPSNPTSSTGALWVGFSGSGAIQVTVFFERA